MPLRLDKSRFYAFTIHILLSAVIFCAVFYVLVMLWYPDIFFTTDGGLKGLQLIALVDVVVGPVLTLILYRQGKKGLKLDMAIIGVLQVSFLIYGIWVLYSHRPAALVFYKDTFYSMGVEKYKSQENGLKKITSVAGSFPGYVAVNLPDDWDEIRELRRRATAKGEALFAQVNYYAPFKYHQKEIVKYAREVGGFLKESPQEKIIMDKWLAKHDKRMEDFIYIPVVSRFKNSILAIDPLSGDIKGCVGISIPEQFQLPFINSSQ
jgi:hypothetical protein